MEMGVRKITQPQSQNNWFENLNRLSNRNGKDVMQFPGPFICFYVVLQKVLVLE